MAVCVNCHVIMRCDHLQHEYHAVDLSPDLVLIIEEWCGREITADDQLCDECVDLLAQEAHNRTENAIVELTPRLMCICCGISLSQRSGRRHRRLVVGSNVRSYIENLIFPRQVPIEAWACNACWMRGYHNTPRLDTNDPLVFVKLEPIEFDVGVQGDEQSESVTEIDAGTSSETESWAGQLPNVQPPADTIYLSGYARTSDTTSHCFVPDCVNPERLRVPRYLKRLIMCQYKIYITENARVCHEHSMLYNWDILNEFEFMHNFSSIQIEKVFDLLCTQF